MALRAHEKFRVHHTTHVDVLAAVYAENGRFDEAVAAQQRAIALAKRPSELKLVPAMQARLMLYYQKRPYREPWALTLRQTTSKLRHPNEADPNLGAAHPLEKRQYQAAGCETAA